jgi:hypothetical protein
MIAGVVGRLHICHVLPSKPIYKTGSTRRTPNSSPKREYTVQSARFFSTAPFSLHPSSPKSRTPYQPTSADPTRQTPFLPPPTLPIPSLSILTPPPTRRPTPPLLPWRRQLPVPPPASLPSPTGDGGACTAGGGGALAARPAALRPTPSPAPFPPHTGRQEDEVAPSSPSSGASALWPPIGRRPAAALPRAAEARAGERRSNRRRIRRIHGRIDPAAARFGSLSLLPAAPPPPLSPPAALLLSGHRRRGVVPAGRGRSCSGFARGAVALDARWGQRGRSARPGCALDLASGADECYVPCALEYPGAVVFTPKCNATRQCVPVAHVV